MSPARDRIQQERRAAVPRRFLMRLLALAAIVAASAGLYGIASAGAEKPVKGGWRWALPGDFPQPKVPRTNPMSKAKVEVGRRLFYDARLSGNGTQSCSSCHRPELAFTDGKALAVGSTGEVHPRNAQSLVNVVYNTTLTWANPALVTLEAQMAVPLFGTDPIEMGITDRNRSRVIARIRNDPWYRKNFPRAFPTAKRAIDWTTVVKSIAAFERSVVSADSKYDRVSRGKARLTAEERRGANLFMGEQAECHHCHGTFIFNDQTTFVGAAMERPLFHNTGLYNVGDTGAFPEPNRGVFEITGKPEDMGKFKAPSLRNVAITGPYMHDGSIRTLEEAVDHYANGGRNITDGPLAGDGRKNPFKDPLITSIRLNPRDRADLVAFLKTLTDTSIATNPKFADPFRRRRR